MKPPKPFAKETDLCAAFLAVLPDTWTAYAEHAGFDILLVRKADGVQIGVEAKLKLNAEVVAQCLEDGGYYRADMANPDYRAVLVPYSDAGHFDRVATYIGFTILRMEAASTDRWRNHKARYRPDLPGDNTHWNDRYWHDWSPTKRCRLPEYVPDVAAGDSAPIKLTEWKIAALRIEATLELRGFVTRADFAHLRIDHRRWLARESGWLAKDEANGRLIAGPRFPNWKGQHPRVYAEIVADAERWMRKEIAP